jgi:hypothetical protein
MFSHQGNTIDYLFILGYKGIIFLSKILIIWFIGPHMFSHEGNTIDYLFILGYKGNIFLSKILIIWFIGPLYIYFVQSSLF